MLNVKFDESRPVGAELYTDGQT